MSWYVELVRSHPIPMAMAQFAVLGTFGDILANWLRERRVFMPFTPRVTLLKMLEWAALAVCIKYAFTGFLGFVAALEVHGLIPEPGYFTRALAVSVSMNLQFGPFLVIMHRLLDNAIDGRPNWANLDKGLYTLLWFWIPAHTVTFMLEPELRIGLAALWSVALGALLGYYNRRPA